LSYRVSITGLESPGVVVVRVHNAGDSDKVVAVQKAYVLSGNEHFTEAGPGGVAFIYTLMVGASEVPLSDADVWVTSDAAGNNIIASGRTDQDGKVVFYLQNGSTVYVWKQKSGWNFTPQPEQFVVG
jgi:hypothetical protein